MNSTINEATQLRQIDGNNNGSFLSWGIGGLIIKRQGQFLVDSGNTDITFYTAFPNYCIAVIPIPEHPGFSAPSTLSVTNITTTGFTLSQKNTADASMYIRYIAIGY
jgi:hypothetical protein